MKSKFLFYFFLLMLISSFSVFGQKIDTVVHVNGNILTGDFKNLNYGVVTWKMDGMGTINLEQRVVNTIKSPKEFEIKLKSGLIYFGSFDTSAIDRSVNILFSGGKELVKITDIVEIYPIKGNFWLRTSGNFSLGLNYSKASGVATLAFSGNLSYRKKKSYFYFQWSDNNTYQGDTLSSTNSNVALSWERMFKHKWSASVILGFTQNSALGTKYRYDITFLGIRDIVYNNWNRLYPAAGLSVQRETPYDGDLPVTYDLAGVVTVVWKVYKFTSPKVSLTSNIAWVPYFTEPGRYRANVNLNPQVKVFNNNFKVGFNFYMNYDSKPSSSSTVNTDYGINLEITYSLH